MRLKLILIMVLLAGVNFSCEDLLEVKTRSQLTEELVLKDVTTAQSFLNGALATMRNGQYYGREFVIFPELLADNCKLVNAGDRSGRGLNQSINLSGAHINIWFLYQTINRLNLLLKAIENGDIVKASQADAITENRIKAQALFLRGLLLFLLVLPSFQFTKQLKMICCFQLKPLQQRAVLMQVLEMFRLGPLHKLC
jgi:starch-binding outer membrane protein, SusD/RagB family